MKRLLIPLTTLAIAALLLPIGAHPAYACPPPIEPTPLPTLVNDSNLIVTVSVVELFLEPPLDPTTPDAVDHWQYARLQVTEFLKGSGPAIMTFGTGVVYWFAETGDVVSTSLDCPGIPSGPPGSPLVLLLKQNGESMLVVAAARTDNPYGQDLLNQIRSILFPAPTPTPSATPAPTPSATATPSPLSLPATGNFSPDSGHASRPLRNAAPSALGAAGLLAASAFLLRRHIMNRG